MVSVSHCLVCLAVGRTRSQEDIKKDFFVYQIVHGCKWKTAGVG